MGLLLALVALQAPIAFAAEQDLLNDPLNFSGATLHIRPYAALPSGFNDIIGMTYRPDDTRMYVTTSEGTRFSQSTKTGLAPLRRFLGSTPLPRCNQPLDVP